jgi:hypothetical protein
MPEPQKDPASSNPPANASPALAPARRRTGNIARLPLDVRRSINQMMDDGIPYEDILSALGEHGTDLNVDMLYRWKKGGYQDHLREQRLIEQCIARRASASALLTKAGQVTGFQATQQIATSQICEAVVDMGADILRQALIANPLNYFRMLNAFSRLTNGGLRCERHLAEEAQRKAESKARPRRGKKGISAASVREMEQKLNLM